MRDIEHAAFPGGQPQDGTQTPAANPAWPDSQSAFGMPDRPPYRVCFTCISEVIPLNRTEDGQDAP
jgi:hypothetical protein